MTEIILMAHVLFGMLFILAGVWLFVDVLHANEANQSRIRTVSIAVAVLMWLAYLVGGYWYVSFYAPDKAIILKGPWPFAHSFFMEMKEHVVIMLLLLATYLPIAAASNTATNKAARKIVLWVVGLMVLIGVAIDGAGAIIGIGVKVGLLASKG
jgi:predicted membrane channel-forming protein YqfA (hemolysin III family)